MKAIVRDRRGSTHVLALRDVVRPTPKEGEVLLRVVAPTRAIADTDEAPSDTPVEIAA